MPAAEAALLAAGLLGAGLAACQAPRADEPELAQPAGAAGELSTQGPGSAESPAADEACVAQQLPIVFASTRSNFEQRTELFMMAADGGKVTRLARDDVHLLAPRWSPDGRDVAFRRWRLAPDTGTEWASVGLVAAHTRSIVTLTPEWVLSPAELPEQRFETATWSPDGALIAYTSSEDSDHPRIWTLSRWGGQRRLLLPELKGPHFGPSWARHDPQWLAYIAEVEGQDDVWVVNLAEPAHALNVTQGRVGHCRGVRWSPNGERLAFFARSSEGDAGVADTEIFAVDLADLRLQQITHNDSVDETPAWSPDGQALLFASNRPNLSAPVLRFDTFRSLWLLSADGAGTALRLTEAGEQNSLSPDWYWRPECGER